MEGEMKLGHVDLCDCEYLIVYSHPETPDVVETWTLPEGSFQLNYKQMRKGGCNIRNIYKRMTEKDLLQAMIE